MVIKEKLSFDPRIDIRMISDGECIEVVEHREDGEEEQYQLPVEEIIKYLQNPTTRIVESYGDTIIIVVERN